MNPLTELFFDAKKAAFNHHQKLVNPLPACFHDFLATPFRCLTYLNTRIAVWFIHLPILYYTRLHIFYWVLTRVAGDEFITGDVHSAKVPKLAPFWDRTNPSGLFFCLGFDLKGRNLLDFHILKYISFLIFHLR